MFADDDADVKYEQGRPHWDKCEDPVNEVALPDEDVMAGEGVL